MFTRRAFVSPSVVDAKGVLDAVVRWTQSLNDKAALEIAQARIAADQGIAFPATQVVSTDANTLDDYNKKDFAASVTDGSGAALTLTITKATATKVGRLVQFRIHATYPATASGAASQINGLPFTTDGVHSAAIYTSGAGGATVCQVSGTVINIYAPGNVAITNANLSAAFVVITGSYST